MRGIKVKSSNNYYFAVAGMTLTLLAGCGASTQSAPAVTVTVTAPVEEPAVVASTEPETAVDPSANDSSSSSTSSATGQGGSIDTAVALGTSLTLDKWKVSVVRFTENATNAVLNENQLSTERRDMSVRVINDSTAADRSGKPKKLALMSSMS